MPSATSRVAGNNADWNKRKVTEASGSQLKAKRDGKRNTSDRSDKSSTVDTNVPKMERSMSTRAEKAPSKDGAAQKAAGEVAGLKDFVRNITMLQDEGMLSC